MGFSQERGDSIKVVSAPFMQEKPSEIDVPLWKQPWLLDMLRAAAVPLALVLVALIAVFGLVRPALRAANPPPVEKTEASQLDALVDDQHELPGPGGLPALEAPLSNDKLERARQLARENPVAVANIMRSWITGEEPAKA
jgi:flagellar M-ring protein FliF